MRRFRWHLHSHPDEHHRRHGDVRRDAQFDAASVHHTYRYAIQELPRFDGKPVEDDDAATPGFQYQGITYDLDARYFTASVEYRDYDSQDLMLHIVMCDKTWKPLTQKTGSIDIVNRSSPTVTSAPLQGRLVLDNRKMAPRRPFPVLYQRFRHHNH